MAEALSKLKTKLENFDISDCLKMSVDSKENTVLASVPYRGLDAKEVLQALLKIAIRAPMMLQKQD